MSAPARPLGLVSPAVEGATSTVKPVAVSAWVVTFNSFALWWWREQRRVEREREKLRALFDYYVEHPPPPAVAGASDPERIVDYLAGMTNRFAVRAFSELSVPEGF